MIGSELSIRYVTNEYKKDLCSLYKIDLLIKSYAEK